MGALAAAAVQLYASSGAVYAQQAFPAATTPVADNRAKQWNSRRPVGRIHAAAVDCCSISRCIDRRSARSALGSRGVHRRKDLPRLPGRITLLSKQAVSREEAVSLLNTVLKPNGYTAIQMGRTLKIVARDLARKQNIPVRTGADPLKVAETDELITQVIPIHYADATQLKTDLTPLIGTDADFTANASSNSIIITDTSANIRRIVEIISALDTSLAASTEVKVFQLKYANATAAAKLITDVFGQQQNATAQNGQGNGRGGGGGGGRFGRGGGGGFGGFGGGGFGGGGFGGGGLGGGGFGGGGGGGVAASAARAASARSLT